MSRTTRTVPVPTLRAYNYEGGEHFTLKMARNQRTIPVMVSKYSEAWTPELKRFAKLTRNRAERRTARQRREWERDAG